MFVSVRTNLRNVISLAFVRPRMESQLVWFLGSHAHTRARIAQTIRVSDLESVV